MLQHRSPNIASIAPAIILQPHHATLLLACRPHFSGSGRFLSDILAQGEDSIPHLRIKPGALTYATLEQTGESDG
jgi:hypothetical protein